MSYDDCMEKKKWFFKPVYWSIIILLIAEALTITAVWRQQPFLDDHNIYVPEQPSAPITIWPSPPVVDPDTGVVVEPGDEPMSSVGVIVIYFAVMIAIIAVVLAVIPMKALSAVFRCIFAFLFAWGFFVILVLFTPWRFALAVALAVGIAWFFHPAIWLHDIAMIVAMCSIASLFGRFISPWTAMVIMGLMAIYDYISVKKGLMLWMVDKMSKVNTMPAFVFPADMGEINDKLDRPSINKIADQKPEDKDYSILGGGDIAFPLILSAACYFKYGLLPTLIMAASAVLGLVLVYFIQAKFLKGRPMPALPPLAVTSLIALICIVVTH